MKIVRNTAMQLVPLNLVRQNDVFRLYECEEVFLRTNLGVVSLETGLNDPIRLPEGKSAHNQFYIVYPNAELHTGEPGRQEVTG